MHVVHPWKPPVAWAVTATPPAHGVVRGLLLDVDLLLLDGSLRAAKNAFGLLLDGSCRSRYPRMGPFGAHGPRNGALGPSVTVIPVLARRVQRTALELLSSPERPEGPFSALFGPTDR